MKTLNTLLFLTLSLSAFAQQGDTLGITVGSSPTFAPSNNVVLYQDINGGYLFGTNAQAQNTLTAIAQAYINLDPVLVTGALAIISRKAKGPSATESKLTFSVHNMSPTGAITYTGPPDNPTFQNVPGPASVTLASADIFFSEIDTAASAFTVVNFANPPLCTGDLAIACNLTDVKQIGDTVGFLGDATGNGLNLRYTFHRVTQPPSTFWFPTDFLFPGTNCNVAIFAITEDATSVRDLNQSTFVQGIRALAYPNPASADCRIEFELADAGEIRFELLSADGRIVQQQDWGKRIPGTYTEQIATDNLASGIYYYSISSSHGGRITRSLVVE